MVRTKLSSVTFKLSVILSYPPISQTPDRFEYFFFFTLNSSTDTNSGVRHKTSAVSAVSNSANRTRFVVITNYSLVGSCIQQLHFVAKIGREN